jgi:5-formyltetrahydrofolate cyclo-ligase
MPDTTHPDRAALRRQLLSDRQEWATTPQAATAQAELQARVLEVLAQLEPMCLGLFWPMQGEFNPSSLALIAAQQWDCRLALPFAKRTPVEMHYRAWTGAQPDTVDECNIATTSGRPIEPDVVLVPCVGFTAQGWRLGYGGGYFDRYLAQHPGITAIGVAWQQGLLADDVLVAQAHDQALMAVITEKGTFSS